MIVESLEVGDLVEAVPPFALACGSGRYSCAVLVSLEPFVLVSESGDMLWRATVAPHKVRRIGKATPGTFAVALHRFNSDKSVWP